MGEIERRKGKGRVELALGMAVVVSITYLVSFLRASFSGLVAWCSISRI